MDGTDRILHYLVHRFSGRLGRTRLLNLLFLADREAVRFLGHPLTDLEYVINRVGPFDSRFHDHRHHLERAGLVTERPRDEKVGFLYDDSGAAPPSFEGFTTAERRIVEHAATRYGEMSRQDLIAMVNALPVVAEAIGSGPGTRVQLEREAGMGADDLGGLDLETVLRGEEEAARGAVVPAGTVESGIRTRLRGERGTGDPEPPR